MLQMPSHSIPEKIALLDSVVDVYKKHYKKLRNINHKKYTDVIVKTLVELINKNVKYQILIQKTSPITYILRYKQWKCDVVVRNVSDNGLLVSLDGRSYVLYAEWNDADQLVLSVDQHTLLFQ